MLMIRFCSRRGWIMRGHGLRLNALDLQPAPSPGESACRGIEISLGIEINAQLQPSHLGDE